jgi:hypothetical protein
MFLKLGGVIGVALLAAACGGSKQPAESADAATAEADSSMAGASETNEPEPSPVADSPSGAAVPSECHRGKEPCLPDPKFVKKLCNNRHPSLALYLFSNPKWARGYLTRKTEAWNASGGASAGGFVEFDEEVLLLFERKADLGGMQVSGAGASYDALRWDGSCVTLAGEEVTRDEPPSAKTPKIEWRFLDDNVQEALRKDENVNAAYLERRKECKGAVSGDVSAKCVKADTKLSASIVAFVRSGPSLPVPTTIPE